MILHTDLIKLLDKYGIDGEKIIKNNENILTYAEYDEVEKIVIYLLDKGFKTKTIEECPSILYMKKLEVIKENYDWFMTETEITFDDLNDCLHVLNSDLEEMKKIYDFVVSKYGIDVLKKSLSILKGYYRNIVSLTKTFEDTVGLGIVKEIGGSILTKTTSNEFIKILAIPEFKYNPIIKKYNKDLLAITTFEIPFPEIERILKLDYWKNPKYKNLLKSSIWKRTADEVKEILELDYWQDKKFQKLLAPSVWFKDANQIKEILDLECLKDDKYQDLLTPNLWHNDAQQIKEILELDYWQDDKYDKLLSSTIWHRKAYQIKEILGLDYWKEEKFQKVLTASIWTKNSTQIKDILDLEYWKNPDYQELLAPNLFRKDAKEITEILELDYWKNPKYKKVLTSTIWHKDAKEVKEILELEYWEKEEYQNLLAPSIWKKDVEQVKEILELDYWQEEKFQKLLTASVWKRKASEVKEILELPYWQDDKYQALLISSIWSKNANQIKTNIEICIKNGLVDYDNSPTLIYRMNSDELVAKINYLNYHNIPVVNNNGKVRDIFSMTNDKMKKKYGISRKDLIRDYLNMEVKNNAL